MKVCVKSPAAFEPAELFSNTYICTDQRSHVISVLFYSMKMKTHMFLKMQRDLPEQSKKQILYMLLNVFQIF